MACGYFYILKIIITIYNIRNLVDNIIIDIKLINYENFSQTGRVKER